MSESTLGTDGEALLSLSAATRNRQSLERFQQFAPALVERFARASLGTLELSFDSVELMPSSSAET